MIWWYFINLFCFPIIFLVFGSVRLCCDPWFPVYLCGYLFHSYIFLLWLILIILIFFEYFWCYILCIIVFLCCSILLIYNSLCFFYFVICYWSNIINFYLIIIFYNLYQWKDFLLFIIKEILFFHDIITTYATNIYSTVYIHVRT